MRLWPSFIGLAAIAAGCGGSAGSSGTCQVSSVNVSANPGTVPTGQASTVTAVVTSTGSCSGGVAWSATPGGGTLTTNGATATFSSGAAATYTLTARSNDDTTQSGSTTVAVTQAAQCGVANGTVVTHSSNIVNSETWAGAGVTHMVPQSIAIDAPATVTIEPCAIVALGQGATITVRGDTTGNRTATLAALGTNDDTGFVAFVRADDSKPWGILRGFNEKAIIDLRHTLVQGGGSFGGQYHNAAIAMAGPGYSSAPAGTLKVDHVQVDQPQGAGIYLDSNAAFTADSNSLAVTGAPDYPLMLTMMAVGSIPTFVGQNNAHDDAFVVGPNANVFANMTIHKRLPIRIQTGSMTIAGPINDTTPVVLTLDPGVVLRFQPLNAQPGARVIFGGNGQDPNNKVGVLVAQGTASEPILFTSGAATPAAGDWVGLWLDTSPGSRLDHVVIEYAGADNGINSVNCRPASSTDDAALVVGDFSTQYVPPANLITNSIIRFSAGHGINAIWQGSDFNPNLTAGNTFTANAGCNQTWNSLTQPCPTGGGCQPQ